MSDKTLAAAETEISGAARLCVPVVFCADGGYGGYLSAVVQSLLDNASAEHDYHIIVFDCGIKPEDLAALARQIAPYRQCRLQFYDISSYLQQNRKAFSVPEGQYLSPATYGRLLIPQICGAYDRLIYADIDMIFRRDPAELLQINLGENAIAGVADSNIEAERRSRRSIRKYCRAALGLADNQIYINAGLLLFNAALWRAEGLVEQCLAVLAKQQFKRHDQDMINFICKGRIYYLGPEWNTYCKLTDSAEAAKQEDTAALYHFVGALKPWHIAPDGNLAGKAALWWEAAARTAAYQPFLQDARANKAGLNLDLGSRSYALFGLPLWRVNTAPKKKKYALFGITIAREKTDSKSGKRIFYLFGAELFRRAAKPL